MSDFRFGSLNFRNWYQVAELVRKLATYMLLGCGAAHAFDVSDVAIEPAVVLEDRYPDRQTEFPGGVTSIADMVYSVRPGYRPLILDLYFSDDDAGKGSARPLVLFLHGGAWMSGHTRHSGAFANWPATLAKMASMGFVVASIEYRLSGEAPFPAALVDVQDAIRWLRSNAQKYGIDKANAVVWGVSAGGQLAALMGTACGAAAYVPAPTPELAAHNPEESACVQGVVAWYGIFDFESIVSNFQNGIVDENDPNISVISQYIGCHIKHCSVADYRAASPVNFIDATDPAFLLIHGDNDAIVNVGQSRTMAARLEAAGVSTELLIMANVGHSFIGATSIDTRDASLLALQASTDFLQQVFGTASR